MEFWGARRSKYQTLKAPRGIKMIDGRKQDHAFPGHMPIRPQLRFPYNGKDGERFKTVPYISHVCTERGNLQKCARRNAVLSCRKLSIWEQVPFSLLSGIDKCLARIASTCRISLICFIVIDMFAAGGYPSRTQAPLSLGSVTCKPSLPHHFNNSRREPQIALFPLIGVSSPGNSGDGGPKEFVAVAKSAVAM